MLIRAARDAARDSEAALSSGGTGKVVRGTQFAAAEGAIRSRLAAFWLSYGNMLQARREEAIAAAVKANIDWDKALLRDAARSHAMQIALTKSLNGAADRNVRLMVDRYTHETIPLSEKVYRTKALADEWVDNQINSALGRGLSSREFAKEVRQFIRPDTPGGVSYAATRLARTEINNANHFAAVQDTLGKPYVTGMGWRRSRSHAERDICDKLAEESPYPIGKVPPKPHPHCFCYVFPETEDDETFVANFRSGKYDSYLADKYGI